MQVIMFSLISKLPFSFLLSFFNRSPKFRLKLLIDEKRNRVVLAESDQDFVDVLISLLTLPMGNIARLLEDHKKMQTVLGCYKNLNRSVADMGIDHFETEACKSMLLSPKSTKEIHCRRLKLNMGDTDATKFFMCPNFLKSDSCRNVYSNFNTSRCRCGELMSAEIQVPEEEQVGEVIGDNEDGVFVNCRSSFIITDDLNVTVSSTGVIMKVLNDLGYLGFSDLQETILDVGFEEVLTLLGCLFTSEAPLTCAFLGTPLTCAFLAKHRMARTQQMLSTPVRKTERAEPGSVCSVKVFVRKSEGKILYAECNEDFIDSLLSFLVLPLELAFSLSNVNTILGCVGNLCRSPCRGASASNFDQIPDYYTCSNNNLPGYHTQPSPTYECLIPPSPLTCSIARQIKISPLSEGGNVVTVYPTNRRYSSSRCSFARKIERSLLLEGDKIVNVYPMNPKRKPGTLSRYGTGFMKKNTKFIVSNDLIITPMNASSTIGFLKKMQVDISDLEEHQISISKVELISILRASLISSSALTNGLANLLLKKPKEET